MKLSPGQKARIDCELPVIKLDNELQFRILQLVLKDWHKSKQHYLCFRIVDVAYNHIDELMQGTSYASFNRTLVAVRGKIGSAINGPSFLHHLSDKTRGQISPYTIADNAAIIRHRWVIKIILSNRARLGIKLEG